MSPSFFSVLSGEKFFRITETATVERMRAYFSGTRGKGGGAQKMLSLRFFLGSIWFHKWSGVSVQVPGEAGKDSKRFSSLIKNSFLLIGKESTW
ncbi:hypothetical protein CDAR_377791 [Caerostris darwini]|uniref:Uncharacterized protein n=1 Tax=Caerostris darwini TaxID=1538125 RepID=A0AAV4TY53_9ARAC|nr:hypothetical protein CDAR_377791 [Caerostris darwini]